MKIELLPTEYEITLMLKSTASEKLKRRITKMRTDIRTYSDGLGVSMNKEQYKHKNKEEKQRLSKEYWEIYKDLAKEKTESRVKKRSKIETLIEKGDLQSLATALDLISIRPKFLNDNELAAWSRLLDRGAVDITMKPELIQVLENKYSQL